MKDKHNTLHDSVLTEHPRHYSLLGGTIRFAAHKVFVSLLALESSSYMRPLRDWNLPVDLIPSTIWPDAYAEKR